MGGRKSFKSILRQDMCLTKDTLHPASVRASHASECARRGDGVVVPLLLSKIHGEQGRRTAGVDEGDVLLPIEVTLLHQRQEFGPSLAGVNGVQ